MEQGKSLHRPSIILSGRSKIICHLKKFGISDFKIADRLAGKDLAANPIDARDDEVASF